MSCKICKSNNNQFYKGKILMKYDVSYYQCESCKFIETEKPYWLDEAYSSAITHLDIGLLNRNLYLLKEIPKIIDALYPKAKSFLDYGGGYGVFVRMMRDLGFDFYRYDTYCDNIFAKHFDYQDSKKEKFDIITSFEVFEHLENPLEEISKMFGFSDTIIFSTLLIPQKQSEFNDWWYVSPETGQHIAFYDKKTFTEIAAHFKCYYYGNGNNLHVLTKQQLDEQKVNEVFSNKPKNFIQRKFSNKKHILRESLINKDLQLISSLLNSGKIKQ